MANSGINVLLIPPDCPAHALSFTAMPSPVVGCRTRLYGLTDVPSCLSDGHASRVPLVSHRRPLAVVPPIDLRRVPRHAQLAVERLAGLDELEDADHVRRAGWLPAGDHGPIAGGLVFKRDDVAVGVRDVEERRIP